VKILITGGAGYLGYSIVKQLVENVDAEHAITIYDNLSRKNYAFFTEAEFGHKPVRFIQGDLLDTRSLQKALEGIDCVVHLAAKVTTPFADAEAHAFDQVNHWGTAQLTTILEDIPTAKKVIYLSSISVYGSGDVLLDEDKQPTPRSFYGISKLEGEKQLGLLAQDREVFILRSGNVYGYNPAYRIDAVINRFLFNANFNGRIQINGSGEQYRAFIHVDKIARAVLHAIDGKLPAGTYNVVEHNLTINDIADHIKQLYPKLESIHVNYNIRMRDVRVATPCRIWSLVPLPEVSLEQELSDFRQQFSF
jgi:UDP-glucose 4-epimerase